MSNNTMFSPARSFLLAAAGLLSACIIPPATTNLLEPEVAEQVREDPRTLCAGVRTFVGPVYDVTQGRQGDFSEQMQMLSKQRLGETEWHHSIDINFDYVAQSPRDYVAYRFLKKTAPAEKLAAVVREENCSDGVCRYREALRIDLSAEQFALAIKHAFPFYLLTRNGTEEVHVFSQEYIRGQMRGIEQQMNSAPGKCPAGAR